MGRSKSGPHGASSRGRFFLGDPRVADKSLNPRGINPGGGVWGSKLTFSSSDLSNSVSLVLSIAVLVLVLDLCR